MEWKDPPKMRRKYTRNRYLAACQELMDHPGNWGRLDTFDDPGKANSTRSNLKNAIRLKRYKLPENAEDFEWTFSVQKEGDPPIWGLYGKAERAIMDPEGEDNA